MKLLKWISVADRFTKVYLDNQFAPLGINSSQHMYLLKICEIPEFYRIPCWKAFMFIQATLSEQCWHWKRRAF